jgi:hypothetical protein
MTSRRLRNRSLSVFSQADSDHIENVDVSDVTCFESDAELTIRENPALEQAEQNANIVVTSNDNVTISTDFNVEKVSMSATQLQELLSTLVQIIQSEICKQTAALVATMESKLAPAIQKLKFELRCGNEKLAESLISKSESANAAIREELSAKISSEIRVVSDKIENVSRNAEIKITTLHNTIESVRACMNERMNAHVVQSRKKTDRQGQRITGASISLLASIKEHKEQVGVTIDKFNSDNH